MSLPVISDSGYYDSEDVEKHHVFDKKLAEGLVNFSIKKNIKNLVDLGCGMGDYVRYLRNKNIDINGFDGNPYTKKITNDLCSVLDLSKPHIFEEKYDYVLSLEVGEHLPKKFEDIFIQNLHNNNKRGIILTWAVEGQGGHGHFNERNNDYIKNKICKLGYTNNVEEENILRSNTTYPWFKNTVMIFEKN